MHVSVVQTWFASKQVLVAADPSAPTQPALLPAQPPAQLAPGIDAPMPAVSPASPAPPAPPPPPPASPLPLTAGAVAMPNAGALLGLPDAAEGLGDAILPHFDSNANATGASGWPQAEPLHRASGSSETLSPASETLAAGSPSADGTATEQAARPMSPLFGPLDQIPEHLLMFAQDPQDDEDLLPEDYLLLDDGMEQEGATGTKFALCLANSDWQRRSGCALFDAVGARPASANHHACSLWVSTEV